MNFTKVKTVIIIFLAAINLLLGIFCVRIVYDSSYISEEETELAQKHLSNSGITVNFNQSHRKKQTLPIYSVSSNIDSEVPEMYKSITEEFFGVSVDSNEYVLTPGGYSVSVMDKNGESLGISSLSEDMAFQCAAGDVLGDNDIERIGASFYGADVLSGSDKSQERIAENLIKRAFGAYELSFNKKGSSEYDGGHIVYFVAELSGAEIPELYVNVYVKDKEVIYCTGKIIADTPRKSYSADLIDAVNIMYCLDDYLRDESEQGPHHVLVTDMFMTYKIFERDISDAYVVPAWLVRFSDIRGNEKTVLFDAITGENRFVIGE